MKVSVLLNNYNYGRYLDDAIQSVLSQDGVDLEVVVVDDGSSDDSRDVISEWLRRDSRVRAMYQENAGQLACFNRAVAAATGELSFFLDSDDMYKPGYLRAAVDFYREHPDHDFVFCARERFGLESDLERPYSRNVDLGFSAYLTLTSKRKVGAPTSSLSARTALLRRFLPIRLEADWKTWADECLNWGSSLAGARKAYFDFVGVAYRVHGNNAWAGRPLPRNHQYSHAVRVARFMRYMQRTLLLEPEAMRSLSELELESNELAVRADLVSYVLAANKHEPHLYAKLRRIFRLHRIYRAKKRMQRTSPASGG